MAEGRRENDLSFLLRGEEATLALARRLAGLLRPGDVVLLGGELGAGKTCFARGIAEGLGIQERVTSPTFTLLREYEGRLPLYHLDAYRLAGPWDLYDLGLEEYLDNRGVLVVEWADRTRGFFDGERLEISLTFAEGGEARRVVMRPHGDSWTERLALLGGEGP